jgi:hypothetical protein
MTQTPPGTAGNSPAWRRGAQRVLRRKCRVSKEKDPSSLPKASAQRSEALKQKSNNFVLFGCKMPDVSCSRTPNGSFADHRCRWTLNTSTLGPAFPGPKETIVKAKGSIAPSSAPIDLGENPVNKYQAREYAKESSPSTIAVLVEVTENSRDNASDVVLTIDIDEFREGGHGTYIIKPHRITCTDKGTGLTHEEFLTRFCGAFSDSETHHEVDRAGRNGVGTKTYGSIADRVTVTTTTARPTEGLDQHREILETQLPHGLLLPKDGDPDTLWRVYDFRLHTRSARPSEWRVADALEMGTDVALCDIRNGTEIKLEVLIERLSYGREWLTNAAHSLTVQLTGNVPPKYASKRSIAIWPWSLPERSWLAGATGRSDQAITIFDRTTGEKITVPPCAELPDVAEFDIRVVGKDSEGQMQSIDRPALLLEVCGALPYGPNLEAGQQSARVMPMLTFVGLEHASSAGAFCNAISGWVRINSLPLKEALRNNKTTLASGPGADVVEKLRSYLHSLIKPLHRAWYNETRASDEAATRDTIREAEEEINFALKGANRNPFKAGEIAHSPAKTRSVTPVPPARWHRWECGSCSRRWLAEAGFTPIRCAEVKLNSGDGAGCGSENIGLAKNQPQIGDCRIALSQLGDKKLPATFQFERVREDLEQPVVSVNIASPRYLELRGTGDLSQQAQRRLKQYLVDVALVAIADYNARARGTDFTEEWGTLYFNRMLRCVGIKAYESQLKKVLSETSVAQESLALEVGTSAR